MPKALLGQLIEKVLHREVWGYWYLTSQSGTKAYPDLKELRKPWADPVCSKFISNCGLLNRCDGLMPAKGLRSSTPDIDMSNLTLEETEILSETSDYTPFSGAPAEDEQIVNTAFVNFLNAVTMYTHRNITYALNGIGQDKPTLSYTVRLYSRIGKAILIRK